MLNSHRTKIKIRIKKLVNSSKYKFLILAQLFLCLGCKNIDEINFQNDDYFSKNYFFFLNEPKVSEKKSFDSYLNQAAYFYSKNQLLNAKEAINLSLKYCEKADNTSIINLLKIYMQIVRAGRLIFEKNTIDICLEHYRFNDQSEQSATQRVLGSFYDTHKIYKSPKIDESTTLVSTLAHDPKYWNNVFFTNIPTFTSSVNKLDIMTFIDTGAESTLISPSLIKRLNLKYEKNKVSFEGIMGTGKALEVHLSQLTIDNKNINDLYALETEEFTEDLIVLGQDTLRAFKKIHYTDEKVILGKGATNFFDNSNSIAMHLINGVFCVLSKDNLGYFLVQLDTGYSGKAITTSTYYHQRLNLNGNKTVQIDLPLDRDKKVQNVNDLPRVQFSLGDDVFESIPSKYKTFQGNDFTNESIILGSAFFTDYFSEYGFDFENMQFHFKRRINTLTEQRKNYIKSQLSNKTE